MFGDDRWADDIAEKLLDQWDLSDILELNDLTEQEVLAILIGAGHVTQPERYFPEDEG